MISVIIPTYNRKRILSRAIKSILGQTYQDIEILVIDDGSTDNTKELFSNTLVDPRIRYENLSSNQGVHIARNRGIEISRGEFLVFLDSDDELFPNALEVAHGTFLNHPLLDIVSAPFLTEQGQLTSFDRSSPGSISYKELLCEIRVRKQKNGFVMIRKQAIGDARFVMQHMDFVFYRKLAKKCKMYFLSHPLGIYHLSSENAALHSKRKTPSIEMSIKRSSILVDFLNEFGDDLLKFCPSKFSSCAYGVAVGQLLGEKKKNATQFAWLAIKYNPQKIRYFLFFLLTISPFSRSLLQVLFKLKRFF